jgi:hypothetical protein
MGREIESRQGIHLRLQPLREIYNYANYKLRRHWSLWCKKPRYKLYKGTNQPTEKWVADIITGNVALVKFRAYHPIVHFKMFLPALFTTMSVVIHHSQMPTYVHRGFKFRARARVTGWFCEKSTQNVAQHIFSSKLISFLVANQV